MGVAGHAYLLAQSFHWQEHCLHNFIVVIIHRLRLPASGCAAEGSTLLLPLNVHSAITDVAQAASAYAAL